MSQEISVSPPKKTPRKQSSFAADVAKLASGTLFAQILGILVTPVLSRLFAPEAFGLVRLQILRRGHGVIDAENSFHR